MPFWFLVVTIHTVYPGLNFLAISSVPCDERMFKNAKLGPSIEATSAQLRKRAQLLKG
jgi:hypothetical protein